MAMADKAKIGIEPQPGLCNDRDGDGVLCVLDDKHGGIVHRSVAIAGLVREWPVQAPRRICNECSHVWTPDRVTSNSADPDWQALATALTNKCPECGSEDTISTDDVLADQVDRHV
jgi:hypothetical protein